jgi:hypothetical protein
MGACPPKRHSYKDCWGPRPFPGVSCLLESAGEIGRGQFSGLFFVTKMLSNSSRNGLFFVEICAMRYRGSLYGGLLYETYKKSIETLYDYFPIST